MDLIGKRIAELPEFIENAQRRYNEAALGGPPLPPNMIPEEMLDQLRHELRVLLAYQRLGPPFHFDDD